jgi:transposase InsO family protein
MSDQMTSQMVQDALIMAIWRRGRSKELLHHSDQDSQYTSEPFQRLLADHGITCAMSRSGNVWEFNTVRVSGLNDPGDHSKAQNAAMESARRSLEPVAFTAHCHR